ncbi:hypothetical protein BD410DRAFT_298266 [Rickenella mellea]|uniref:Uncharacterized protein n=1 Tax=Rickenella mellea TaxID=50990 RepID=A0A4Y7Q0Y8_9AGAM|nr:hypothetical protein BD410DRAFT_298266 [Rickenella mellea]
MAPCRGVSDKQHSWTRTASVLLAREVTCSICSNQFSAKGIQSHTRSCEKAAKAKKLQVQRRRQGINHTPLHAESAASTSSSQTNLKQINTPGLAGNSTREEIQHHDLDMDIDLERDIGVEAVSVIPALADSGPQIPPIGTYVRIQHHPSSKLPDKVYTLDEYLESRAREDTKSTLGLKKPDATVPKVHHKLPWFPFKTEADFDFAEFAHKYRLTNPQVDDHLRRMRSIWCKGGDMDLTFKSHHDIDAVLEAMREIGVKFMTKTSSAAYNDYTGEEVHVEFEYQVCSLLDVVRNVIRDPVLSRHIQWFPTRRFLIIDGKEQQFIDDVDCTLDWWTYQTIVAPIGGIYIPLMIYADGTQAYRFRGKKFHPIILRLAFLPSDIRNTTGKGGGTLIGWIPEIDMPATEKENVSFTDFRNKIVHIVLTDLFSTIRLSSQIGEPITGLDDVKRLLCIGVTTVSLDFEEATTFANTRGVKALFPCPICLVPHDALNVISEGDYSRTQEQSIKIYKETEPMLRRHGTITTAENVLKRHGLRPVRNSFWSIHNSDIHKAIAYDIGHGIDGGIAKRLILGVFEYLSNKFKDRRNLSIIDDRFSLLKAWTRWVHLEKITEVSYVDQKTWLCIFMRILGVVWDLEQDGRRSMKHILTCIRALACLRCILGIHFILNEHLNLAERFVKRFADSLPNAGRVLGHDLNIPKIHLLIDHAVDHIRRKGPLKDIGTMLGEHGHVEVHEDFEQVSGFESEKQVVKLRETRAMLQVIRERVDEYSRNEEGESSTPDNTLNPPRQNRRKTKALPLQPVLGSPQHKFPAWQLDQVDVTRSSQSEAFRNSCQQLLTYLKEKAASNVFPEIADNGNVQPYESLQLCYRSLSTQSHAWEYVHCSEQFYRRTRYDCVLVDCPSGQFFARLQGLYTCTVFKKLWSVARVTKLKPVQNQRSNVIGFPHVREERSGVWIDISCITRFVYEQPTFERRDEYFINDTMDSDMFLRLLVRSD